ncbi:hypothetical protein L6164_015919 [Bauhinia variegata]|uniref:Uncharacterized protein n=1 Tax=Bauhinia variegata TaxID=167791 RepID=A0ACB9NM07_BAUVA|nr:hypothetical protein L6164_015919 [Bauhinia variegata]
MRVLWNVRGVHPGLHQSREPQVLREVHMWAVNQEMDKNGAKPEEALEEHASACVKFNRIGRSYPVLYQAQAIKEIMKTSSPTRAKSVSPRDHGENKGGIAKSSSCILTIFKVKKCMQ